MAIGCSNRHDYSTGSHYYCQIQRPVIRLFSAKNLFIFSLSLLGLAVVYCRPQIPKMYTNFSHSMPVGLYQRVQIKPMLGAIVVVTPPKNSQLSEQLACCLGSKRAILKRVVATAGSQICHQNRNIFIQNHEPVLAQTADKHGNKLSTFPICRALKQDEFYLLGDHPNSLDSRYFGPILRQHIQAVVEPLLTFS